jgi:hypothetical protein
MDIAFVIYTCKKNLPKAEILYSILKGRLNRCLVLIAYGQDNLEIGCRFIGDKYIILSCGDEYEYLSNKTVSLFKAIHTLFPDARGCFKCDDDIIPHIGHINSHVDYILEKDPDYSGKNIYSPYTYATWHFSKNIPEKYKTPTWIPECNYCPGPLYYLSKKSIMTFKVTPDYHLFEDVMVGMHLHINGIDPDDVPLIQEHKSDKKDISFHNDGNIRPYLFVLLHGRFGNHLFQTFSAYGMAKRSGRKLVIIGEEVDPPGFLSEILKDDALYICQKNIDYLSIERYDETNEYDPRINCYLYNPNIVSGFGTGLGFLYGYFQNEKYFSDYKDDVRLFMKNDEISSRVLSSYPDLGNSYFIHVRRGDYVSNPTYASIYVIDYDYYYKTAIFYILDKDPSAKFYIVSDDIEYCKTYSIFSGLNCVFIDNMGAIDTLYFMSLCSKGGICCNSSFSWWGSYLNANEDKTVIMPKKWNNLSKPVDIFYEGVIVI